MGCHLSSVELPHAARGGSAVWTHQFGEPYPLRQIPSVEWLSIAAGALALLFPRGLEKGAHCPEEDSREWSWQQHPSETQNGVKNGEQFLRRSVCQKLKYHLETNVIRYSCNWHARANKSCQKERKGVGWKTPSRSQLFTVCEDAWGRVDLRNGRWWWWKLRIYGRERVGRGISMPSAREGRTRELMCAHVHACAGHRRFWFMNERNRSVHHILNYND